MRKNKFVYDEALYPSNAREYVTRGLLVTAMIIAAMGIAQCVKEPRQAPAPVAVKSTNPAQVKLEQAFEKAGSPVPHQMAKACMATKNPKLMASVAIVESEGTPWARGKSGEKGAWQVIAKHHGAVSDNPVQQALQAERILDELVAEAPRGSLLQGLSAYNTGRFTSPVGRRYALKVLKVRKTLG